MKSNLILIARENPEFQNLENDVLVDPFWNGYNIPMSSLNKLNELSKKWFGCTYSEVEMESIASQLQVSEKSDEKAAELVLALGVDFFDVQQRPMRIGKYFFPQAEASVRGIAGSHPAQRETDPDAIHAKLEKEAKAFKLRRQNKR